MPASLHHIRHGSLLGNLADQEVAEIVAACQPVELPSGAVVCQQDEPGESMFVIVQGRVRIDIADETSTVRTLNYLGAGDHFGEMSMLMGSPRSATVTTVMDSQLLELSRPDFERTLTEVPSFAANLSRSLGRWLRGQMSSRRRRPETMHGALVRGCAAANGLTPQLCQTLVSEGYSVTVLSDQRRPPPPDDCWIRLDPESARFQDDLRKRMDAVVAARQRVLIDIDHSQATTSLLRQQESVWWVLDSQAEIDSAQIISLQKLLQTAPELAARIQIVWIQTAGQPLRRSTPLPCPVTQPAIRIQADVHGDQATFRPHDVARLSHRMRGIQLGIALGGGGARGMAHLGVLEVCEREGIYFDRIAGTSAGAIIAVGYAAGMPIAELLQLFENEMAPGRAWRWLPRAKQWYLLSAFRWGLLEAKFRRYVADYTFEHLLLPVQTVSVDLITGEPRIRSSGDVVNAILESINHPIFGRPILRDGEALVDGGVLMNVPVAALEREETDFTVAVDVGKVLTQQFAGNTPTTLTGRMKRPHYLATLLRVMEVEQKNLATLHGARSDVLIAPETGAFAFDDFTQGAGLITAGREAAEAAMPRLKRALAENFAADSPAAGRTTRAA